MRGRDATRVNGKIAKPRKKKLGLRCRHHYRRSRLRARFYVFYLWPRALCVNINNVRVFGDRLHKKTSCSLTCVYWRLIKSCMRFARSWIYCTQPYLSNRKKKCEWEFLFIISLSIETTLRLQRTVHKSYRNGIDWRTTGMQNNEHQATQKISWCPDFLTEISSKARTHLRPCILMG
jgi:hypothetical protein